MCVRAYILAVRGFLLVLHIICIYLQAIVCFCSCNSNVLDIIISSSSISSKSREILLALIYSET